MSIGLEYRLEKKYDDLITICWPYEFIILYDMIEWNVSSLGRILFFFYYCYLFTLHNNWNPYMCMHAMLTSTKRNASVILKTANAWVRTAQWASSTNIRLPHASTTQSQTLPNFVNKTHELGWKMLLQSSFQVEAFNSFD